MGRNNNKNNKNRGNNNVPKGQNKGNNNKGVSNKNTDKTGINSSLPGMLTSQALADIAANKQSAGNVYIPIPVGERFSMPPKEDRYGTPGIETIYYSPTFGYNDVASSKLQRTAEKIHQDIYAYLTTNVNFEPTDTMLYIIGLSQIYAWNATLCRLANVLGFTSFSTDYDRRGFVRALGFDYADLVRKQTQLREHIRDMRISLSKFALPPNAAYSARHEWLNSNIFMDEANTQAQMYAFVQRTYLKYDEQRDPETGLVLGRLIEIDNPQPVESTVEDDPIYYNKGLVHAKVLIDNSSPTEQCGFINNVATPTMLTMDDIINITEQMLNPFIGNESIKKIRGYIEKAYTGRFRTIPVYDDPDSWTPVYDSDVLMQIENCTLLGHMDPSSLSLYEDNTGKVLLSTPMLQRYQFGTDTYSTTESSPGNDLIGSRLVNLHEQGMPPDKVMLATKMTNIPTADIAENYHIRTARTEVAEFALIWVTDYLSSAVTNPDSHFAYTEPIYYWNRFRTVTSSDVSTSTMHNLMTGYLNKLSTTWYKWNWMVQFKNHPICMNGMFNKIDSYTGSFAGTFWPQCVLDTFATIAPDRLYAMAQNDLEDQFFPR